MDFISCFKSATVVTQKKCELNYKQATKLQEKIDFVQFMKKFVASNPHLLKPNIQLCNIPLLLVDEVSRLVQDSKSSVHMQPSIVQSARAFQQVAMPSVQNICIPPIEEKEISQVEAKSAIGDASSSKRQTDRLSDSSSDSSSSSPSSSDAEYSFLNKQSVIGPAGGGRTLGKVAGLNLSIVSNHASQVNSARASQNNDVTDRDTKQQKIEKFGPILSKITDFIFLSGIEPTQNEHTLKSVGITHILNLCGDLDSKFFEGINYFKVRLKDATTDNVSCLFMECFAFMQHARDTGGKVVVHCHQGVSRSSSTVISYLMMCNDISFQDAYSVCRVVRPVVSPNTGFIFQVLQWYKDMHHFTQNQIFSQELRKKFEVSLKLVDKQSSKDSGIRDMMNSAFLKIAITPRTKPKAQLFKLTYLYTYQPIFLFKRVPNTSVGRPFLDFRMIFLVPYFPGGTAVFIGKGIEHNEPMDCIEDVPPRDFYESNPVGIDFFRKWIDIDSLYDQVKVIRIPKLMKLTLLRQLALHVLYMGFDPNINVYYQSEIEKLDELNFSDQKFLSYIYIMSKLGIIDNEFEEIDGIISGDMMDIESFHKYFQFGKVETMNNESDYIAKLYLGKIQPEIVPTIPIPHILDKLDASHNENNPVRKMQTNFSNHKVNSSSSASSSTSESQSQKQQTKEKNGATGLQQSQLCKPELDLSQVHVNSSSSLKGCLKSTHSNFSSSSGEMPDNRDNTQQLNSSNAQSSKKELFKQDQSDQEVVPSGNQTLQSGSQSNENYKQQNKAETQQLQLIVSEREVIQQHANVASPEVQIQEKPKEPPSQEQIQVQLADDLQNDEQYQQRMQQILQMRAEMLKTKPRQFSALMKQFYVKIQDYNISKPLDIERYFTRTGDYSRIQKMLQLSSQPEMDAWGRLNLFNLMRLGRFDFRDGYVIEVVREQKALLFNPVAVELFEAGETKYFLQDGGKMSYGNVRMLFQNYFSPENLETIMSLLVQRTLEFADFAYLVVFAQWLSEPYHEMLDFF